MVSRQSVRTIACAMSQALFAIVMSERPIGPSRPRNPGHRANVAALRDPRHARPDADDRGNKRRHRHHSSTKGVQSGGIAPGQGQHGATGRSDGMHSVRRRLSTIFQRWIPGKRSPRIHRSSCQSPRAQRCCRAAGEVVRRRALEELDVGDEPGAREEPSKGRGSAACSPARARRSRARTRQRRRSLPGVRSLAEEILVDIRDGARVRIDAAGAREEPLKVEPPRPGSGAVTRGCSTASPPRRGASPGRSAAGSADARSCPRAAAPRLGMRVSESSVTT